MAIEQVDLLNQIKTQLAPYCTGATIYTEKDPFDLVKERKLPFVIVKMTNFTVTAADNLPMQQMERHNYEIFIYFACAAKNRDDAVMSNTGIWSLYNDIKKGLDSDLTFNRLCSSAPIIPETAVNCIPQQEGLKWLGRGEIKFTLYKNVRML